MIEIPEDTWNEELSKLFLVNIRIREDFFLTEYNTEIQNLERRNSEYELLESQRELESQRLQLLEDIQWTHQVQRERIYLCGEVRMKDCPHQECYARSCQEFEELNRRCYQEEDWKIFLRSMISNHAIFYDPDLLSSCDDLRSSSSSYYLEFKKTLPRSWNAAKYTRKYEYSWKRF